MGKKGRRQKKKKTSNEVPLPTYDRNKSYSLGELEELVRKIPPILKNIQDEISTRINEINLYEEEDGTEKEQLAAAKEALKLYHKQQNLFITMGHLTVDQCKKHKSMAMEKERLLKELLIDKES